MATAQTMLSVGANAYNFTHAELHTADSADGTTNTIAGTRVTVTIGSATSGVRDIASPVQVTSSEVANADASHFSLWDGATFVGTYPLSSTVTLVPGIANNITSLAFSIADAA